MKQNTILICLVFLLPILTSGKVHLSKSDLVKYLWFNSYIFQDGYVRIIALWIFRKHIWCKL